MYLTFLLINGTNKNYTLIFVSMCFRQKQLITCSTSVFKKKSIHVPHKTFFFWHKDCLYPLSKTTEAVFYPLTAMKGAGAYIQCTNISEAHEHDLNSCSLRSRYQTCFMILKNLKVTDSTVTDVAEYTNRGEICAAAVQQASQTWRVKWVTSPLPNRRH